MTAAGGEGKAKAPIRVVVRCRPLSKREQDEEGGGGRVCLSCHGNRVVVGGEPNALPGPVKEFGFDKVFHGGATQADVYEGFGASLAEAALQGYNT